MRRMRWLQVFLVFLSLGFFSAAADDPPKIEKAPPGSGAASEPPEKPATPLLSLSGSDAQPIVRRFDDAVDILNELTEAFRQLATDLGDSSSPAEFAAQLEHFCDTLEKFMDRMEQFRIAHPELQNPRNRDAAKEVQPALEQFQKVMKEIGNSDAARRVDRKYAKFRSDPSVRLSYKRLQDLMKDFSQTKPAPKL